MIFVRLDSRRGESPDEPIYFTDFRCTSQVKELSDNIKKAEDKWIEIELSAIYEILQRDAKIIVHDLQYTSTGAKRSWNLYFHYGSPVRYLSGRYNVRREGSAWIWGGVVSDRVDYGRSRREVPARLQANHKEIPKIV